jgi:uncharacterized membrane protein YkoI
MFSRCAFLLAVAACLAPSPAARADPFGHGFFDSVDDDDDGYARRAVQQGQIRSAKEIMAQVRGELGGKVIDADLKSRRGVHYYEFKVRSPSGYVSEISVDAATGAVIRRDY